MNESHNNNIKVYVAVNEDRLTDGTILPRAVTWEDGVRYEIDRVLDWQRAASFKAGGTGIRYRVRINGRVTYLWLEEDRWFVERRRGPATSATCLCSFPALSPATHAPAIAGISQSPASVLLAS